MTDLTTDNDSALENLGKICTEYEICHWDKTCKHETTHLLICYKCNGAHAVCTEHWEGLSEQYGPTIIIFHDKVCKHACLTDSVQVLAL